MLNCVEISTGAALHASSHDAGSGAGSRPSAAPPDGRHLAVLESRLARIDSTEFAKSGGEIGFGLVCANLPASLLVKNRHCDRFCPTPAGAEKAIGLI